MTEENQKTEKSKIPDNVVFIGTKFFMNYIQAVQRQFQTQKEIWIKARGKNISRAVDVAECITKKFMKDEVEIAEIKTDSEEFEPRETDKNKNNKKISISSIDIKLVKKKKEN